MTSTTIFAPWSYRARLRVARTPPGAQEVPGIDHAHDHLVRGGAHQANALQRQPCRCQSFSMKVPERGALAAQQASGQCRVVVVEDTVVCGVKLGRIKEVGTMSAQE